MWEHTSAFIKKAGSLILIMSLFIWLLLAIPVHKGDQFAQVELEDSAYAAVASTIAPILKPAGFGSWQTAGALISGLAAKEVIVTSLAQVYGTAEQSDQSQVQSFLGELIHILNGFGHAMADIGKAFPGLFGIDLFSGQKTSQEELSLAPAIQAGFETSSNGHSRLAALAFMVFILTYTPCAATLGALKKELGMRWMLLSASGQLLIAWLLGVIVFQGGILFGLG
jgi:ferrous iron transport protein B